MTNYTAWEPSEGLALDQVATFSRYLLSNSKAFDLNTQPPLDEVEYFLTNNYSKMVGMLSRFGISKNQTDLDVLRVLMSYQVYMTCVDVELSQKNAGGTNRQSERFKFFEEKVKEFSKMLQEGNIVALPGIVVSSTNNFAPFATGTSKARKEVLESDENFVKADITRDMMLSGRVTSSFRIDE